MSKTSEDIRTEKGLLTVETFNKLVEECLGVVPVLCIVGQTRTGKTWAATDWMQEQIDLTKTIAYVDCTGVGFGNTADVQQGNVRMNSEAGHYPALLDGANIVIIDEPLPNMGLVRNVLTRTSITPGASPHQLLILLIQAAPNLIQLGITEPKDIKCHTVTRLSHRFLHDRPDTRPISKQQYISPRRSNWQSWIGLAFGIVCVLVSSSKFLLVVGSICVIGHGIALTFPKK